MSRVNVAVANVAQVNIHDRQAAAVFLNLFSHARDKISSVSIP